MSLFGHTGTEPRSATPTTTGTVNRLPQPPHLADPERAPQKPRLRPRPETLLAGIADRVDRAPSPVRDEIGTTGAGKVIDKHKKWAPQIPTPHYHRKHPQLPFATGPQQKPNRNWTASTCCAPASTPTHSEPAAVGAKLQEHRQPSARTRFRIIKAETGTAGHPHQSLHRRVKAHVLTACSA